MSARSTPTYYELLDVEPDAKRDAIALGYQRALEALAQEHNTDPQARAALRKAFEVLSDPIQRMSYDLTVRPYESEERYTEHVPVEEGSLIASIWEEHWGKVLLATAVLIGIVMWSRSGTSSNANVPSLAEQRQVATSGTTSQAESDGRAGGATGAKSDTKPVAAATGVRSAEEVFSQVSGSVVRINVANAAGMPVATGSGVAIASGTVITNCHVALRGDNLEVKASGSAYSASVDAADEERDLCRLSVPGLTATPATLGSVASVRVGQRVFAIGAPQGLDLTISDGIVSALRDAQGSKMIQTSAPVSPGSSGGGLFDTSGRLIGVVTFQHKYGQNLNFAVPADWVSDIKNR